MKSRTFKYALMGSATAITLSMGLEAAAQNIQLEEIVVTARKRDESIYEIPVSVTAISDTFLTQAGIDDAAQLSEFVPGLDFRQEDFGGSTNPNIRVRGMIQQIITPSTQIGALFWNGSYIGGGGGFLPLGDLERVEVVKGPQTAYFGRNTFAGAINYIPKRAGDEWEGDISVEFSPTGHNEYTVEGGVGGPVTDQLGVRFWAGYERDGGDFSFGDGEPFAQQTNWSINSTIDYEATENLRVSLTGYYANSEDTTFGMSALATVPPGSCGITLDREWIDPATGVVTPFQADLSQSPIDLFCGTLSNRGDFIFPDTRYPTEANEFFLANITGLGDTSVLTTQIPLADNYGIIRDPEGGLGGWHQTYRAQAQIDYDFADHTFTFLTSHANTGTTTRLDQFFGNPTSPAGVGEATILMLGNSRAQKEMYYEGRVTSAQDQPLRYMGGVSWYKQNYIDMPDPGRLGSAAIDEQRSVTFGIFASASYDITDDLTLDFEGRYQEETFTAVYNGAFDDDLFGVDNDTRYDNRVARGDIPGTGAGTDGFTEAQPCGIDPILAVCDEKDKVSAFLPRVILSYNVIPGANVYASWSQSKILGLATQAASVALIDEDLVPPGTGTFTPAQKATQYEIGWKQQWDNWNMTLAIYQTDWDNQPIPTVVFLPNGAGTTSLRLPGSSEYQGFDLEVSGNVTDWWNVRGQVAYADGKMTRYDQFGSNETTAIAAPGPVVADGRAVRNNPPWSGSISSTFYGTVREKDWFFRTDMSYIGKRYVDYIEYNTNDARIQVNVRVGLQLLENLEVQAFGNNIFNDLEFPTTSGTTTGYNFGAGRSARKIFASPPQAREFGFRINADF